MPTWIVLLRAVNVGGTGKLAMAEFRRLCEQAGGRHVRTYIASGNAVLQAPGPEAALQRRLQETLHTGTGTPIGVIVRSPEQLEALLAANPFRARPPNRVVALFLDAPPPADPLAGATGHTTEELATGPREILVYYPDSIANSRLKLPAARTGTARNFNTITKLAELAARHPQAT